MKKIDHNIQCKAHLRLQVGPLGPPGALEWRNAGLQMGQNWSLGAPKQVMLAPLGRDETNIVPRWAQEASKTGFEGPKGTPWATWRPSKGSLGAPEGTQEEPKGPKKAPRGAQEGSKRGQEDQKWGRQKC